jgi:CRISPR-associated protein Cas6
MSSYVDVKFSVQGDLLPVDHGYLLFSALSRVIPHLHGDSSFGVHAISGQLVGDRLQALGSRSALTIRAPIQAYPNLLALAGTRLRIGRFEVHVGVPQISALVPSERLYSRLTVIKGFTQGPQFLEATRRQLEAMDIRGTPYLIEQPEVMEANRDREGGSQSPYLRRTVRIRDKEIVGFALAIWNLEPRDSVALQEKGIGGRRRFGCGLFVPDKRPTK